MKDQDAFQSIVKTEGETNIRHLWYRDVPVDRCSDNTPHPERMAAHHDLDIFTLIHQTPCDNGFVSLQGQFSESSEWVDIPALPGTLVVTCGEVLSIISGGVVQAATHRVTVPPSSLSEGSARASTALFWQPHADFKVKPPPDTDFGLLALEYPEDGLPFEEWHTLAFANLRTTQQKAE